jgi:hypothetical protein
MADFEPKVQKATNVPCPFAAELALIADSKAFEKGKSAAVERQY